MPTGGGKSLTFQVPTMATEGICIVVTPLIALMKDQVENLRCAKIKATAVFAEMTRNEIITQLENCIFGDYKFLYVSPERLSTPIFIDKLQAMNVCYLVIDESHCISQWGYDFRPSYLKIAEIRKIIPHIPVLALTATATSEVAKDIQNKLHFKKECLFQKSFSRDNLSYIVRKANDKINTLIYILGKVQGSGIVYVRNRKRTKEIALALQAAQISADYFHAGLSREQKNRKQSNWKNNTCRIIVSTNAFGMGIDKPDVRLVIHLDMPGTLEEYYQEAGRAGRDEKKAYAVVLYHKQDITQLKKRTSEEFPPIDFIKKVYNALGNYYQIAVGAGFNATFDFNLKAFCSIYKFSFIQTYHALKILTISGYIQYNEDTDSKSRLLFTATRDELYRYKDQNPEVDDTIRTILRSYTGLFADYVYINEEDIAQKIGTSSQEIYNILVTLSKFHIVNYIPKKQTQLIIFTEQREDPDLVHIPSYAYSDRKERFEKRINEVIYYIENSTQCRSQILLNYFGEKKGENCGVCDICLKRNESGLTNITLEHLQKEIKNLLIEKDHLHINELINLSSFPSEKVIAAVRYLSDNNTEIKLQDGYVYLISS